MKPFLFAAAIAVVLSGFCTSFTPVKDNERSSLSALRKDNQHYYWYLTSGDVYQGWYTVADEIWNLESTYGIYVDANPANGGFELARAYVFYGKPHLIWSSVILYGHY